MELAKKHAEKLRFAVVGVANTGIDFGILFLLSQLFGVPDILANIISTSVALTFSFFVNRSFTFKSGGKLNIKQAVLFVVITLFGLWVLQNIIIVGIDIMLAPLNLPGWLSLFVGKLLASVVSLTWNYIMYSRFVFKKAPAA